MRSRENERHRGKNIVSLTDTLVKCICERNSAQFFAFPSVSLLRDNAPFAGKQEWSPAKFLAFAFAGEV